MSRAVVIRRAFTFSLFSFQRYLNNRIRMPSALVLLAEGAEEMEMVISADVLTRGGVDVTIAGLAGVHPVECSRQVVIVPKVDLAEVAENQYDAVVCPGGVKGAESIAKSSLAGKILHDQYKRGAMVACICAAPIALASHGIASGKTITSHPSVKQLLVDAGYNYSEDRVVVDGNLVTSRGPGTSFEFALKMVELLQGKEKRDAIVPPMILKE